MLDVKNPDGRGGMAAENIANERLSFACSKTLAAKIAATLRGFLKCFDGECFDGVYMSMTSIQTQRPCKSLQAAKSGKGEV